MIRIFFIDNEYRGMEEHEGVWYINNGCLVCEFDEGEITQKIYPLHTIDSIDEVKVVE